MKGGECMKVNLTIGIAEWVDKVISRPIMIYRRMKYGYTFRRIYVGDGEWAIVDEGDYRRLSKYKWSIVGDEKHKYAARILREKKYGRIKTVYLHREIMNAPKGLVVDHINNKGLDDRRANLRLATHSQNCCNRPIKGRGTSKYVGVCFVKSKKRWCARTKYYGKAMFLGYYDCEIEAAKAYDAGAKKYHGEFARLNFPEEAKAEGGRYF